MMNLSPNSVRKNRVEYKAFILADEKTERGLQNIQMNSSLLRLNEVGLENV